MKIANYKSYQLVKSGLVWSDEWLTSEGILRETECGNLKPPPRKVIVQWILKSWTELFSDDTKSRSLPVAYRMPLR